MKNRVDLIRTFGIMVIVLVCAGVKLFGEAVRMPAEALRESSSGACRELYNHLIYWKTDTVGIADPKGLGLLATCDLQDPCTQLRVHEEYWGNRGYAADVNGNLVGGDPVRWGLLKAGCETKKHVIDPAVTFTKDLLQGKMPAVFKLHGKLSGKIEKVPDILAGIIKAVDDIPKTFAMMYGKLGVNQPVLDAALNRAIAAQKQVNEMLEKIKTDPKITPKLRASLIRALTELTKTLPMIETVLKTLRSEIHTLIPLSLPTPRNKQRGESVDDYKAYLADYNKYITREAHSAGVKQAQDIQKAVDAVKEAINRKTFYDKDLATVVQHIGEELAKRNL